LKLQYDGPVSHFAFNIHVRRYTQGKWSEEEAEALKRLVEEKGEKWQGLGNIGFRV
jgi:hypothetical protein